MSRGGRGRLDNHRRYVDVKKLRFIAKALGQFVPPGARGLDAGCGRGGITASLASLSYPMVGIDIELRATPTDGDSGYPYRPLAYLLADAESLPFQPGSFHFAICSEILEHLHRPERALREAFRALGEGGWLIVTVPNGYGLHDLLFHHLRDAVARVAPPLRSNAEVGGHVQAFTLGRIRKLVERVGFRVERVEHADFLSWLPLLDRWRWLGRLDCALAGRLPPWLVGGYFLLCRKGLSVPSFWEAS